MIELPLPLEMDMEQSARELPRSMDAFRAEGVEWRPSCDAMSSACSVETAPGYAPRGEDNVSPCPSARAPLSDSSTSSADITARFRRPQRPSADVPGLSAFRTASSGSGMSPANAARTNGCPPPRTRPRVPQSSDSSASSEDMITRSREPQQALARAPPRNLSSSTPSGTKLAWRPPPRRDFLAHARNRESTSTTPSESSDAPPVRRKAPSSSRRPPARAAPANSSTASSETASTVSSDISDPPHPRDPRFGRANRRTHG